MRAQARTITAAILAVAVTFSTFLVGLTAVQASNGLDLVRDNVGTNAPQQIEVSHDLYFVLPPDAQQVTPSDWVIISYPNYTDPHGTIEVTGGFGTPTITRTGTTVKITNISILPGTGLEVFGFTATNPAPGLSQAVNIKIAEDSNGTVVRNSATTVPIAFGGYVNVSATVETVLSALSVSGYTSPSAFTIMTEDGVVVGTTVSSGTGFFSFSINGLTPGSHTYAFSSTDQANLSSSSAVLSFFLIASTITTYTGLLLSPSETINKSQIDPGETITVSGSAKPSSQVNIFLQSPLRSYLVTSAVDGTWSFVISASETTSLTPGQYQVYTIVQDGIGNQSIASPTVNFTVKTPDSSNPPPACDISHGDLNCNGQTNLTDFSILLFHWQTNHKVADINSDGHVNLTDFSIMMFYFTR
jgi:hypothetical protein